MISSTKPTVGRSHRWQVRARRCWLGLPWESMGVSGVAQGSRGGKVDRLARGAWEVEVLGGHFHPHPWLPHC